MKYLKYILAIFVIFTVTACSIDKDDALKFKEEYEALNGTLSSTGKKIKNISISSSNPIKYSSYDEIIDVIKNKTGVIYFGFPECPWCRTALPVLLKSAEEYNIDKIYYMNMERERDFYEVKDGKLVLKKDENGKEIKGSKGYFKLLKLLDSELDDYIVKDDNQKEYKVNEKRMYVPFVVFVKNGKIIGTHQSTVSSQIDAYSNLTDDQYDELSGIYQEYLKKISNNYCDDAC